MCGVGRAAARAGMPWAWGWVSARGRRPCGTPVRPGHPRRAGGCIRPGRMVPPARWGPAHLAGRSVPVLPVVPPGQVRRWAPQRREPRSRRPGRPRRRAPATLPSRTAPACRSALWVRVVRWGRAHRRGPPGRAAPWPLVQVRRDCRVVRRRGRRRAAAPAVPGRRGRRSTRAGRQPCAASSPRPSRGPAPRRARPARTPSLCGVSPEPASGHSRGPPRRQPHL